MTHETTPIGTRPLRILLLITRLNIGGPAVQVVTLANALSPLYRILLVSGTLPDGEGDMSYIADGLGVQPTYIPELSREISITRDIRALLRLLRLVRQFRPDILHTHTAKAGTLGRTAAILANILRLSGRKMRIVHTFHGHTFYGYFGRKKTLLFKSIERILSRFTDRIIAISPSQKDDLCRRYAIAPAGRVRVVPLGFDLRRFGPQNSDREPLLRSWFPGDTQEVFLAALVGRLTDVKNPRMVLSVAEILKRRKMEASFRFLIVGDGEMRGSLQREVHRLGLQKMVAFTGWQRNIETIYASVDAVILTSINEGTPVSLIEAMASATPVISASVGGVRDLMGIESHQPDRSAFRILENGLLVNAGDAAAMASALIHVMEHHRSFIQKAQTTRDTIQQRYCTERVVNDMSTLYRSLFRTSPQSG